MFAKSLTKFWADRSGATAIEYGLIAGAIALAIVAAVFLTGGDLNSMFGFMSNKMATAASNIS